MMKKVNVKTIRSYNNRKYNMKSSLKNVYNIMNTTIIDIISSNMDIIDKRTINHYNSFISIYEQLPFIRKHDLSQELYYIKIKLEYIKVNNIISQINIIKNCLYKLINLLLPYTGANLLIHNLPSTYTDLNTGKTEKMDNDSLYNTLIFGGPIYMIKRITKETALVWFIYDSDAIRIQKLLNDKLINNNIINTLYINTVLETKMLCYDPCICELEEYYITHTKKEVLSSQYINERQTHMKYLRS